MFDTTVPYYDLIHSYKDYATEAETLVSIIRREHPAAKTILDVACGTGEHAKRLALEFTVDGIDIQPAFITAARQKVPSAEFYVADMRRFNTGKQYDVLLCLFSSIGYLTNGDDVVKAMTRFADHLRPGGLLIVEPWFTPDRWQFNQPWLTPAVNGPPIKLCGMTTSRRQGSTCVLLFDYLLGEGGNIRHFHEHHEMGMYTAENMSEFFRSAGFVSSYRAADLNDRGLYLARQIRRP